MMNSLFELKRLYLLLFAVVFLSSQLFLNVFAITYVERLLVEQRLEQNEQLVRMALDAVKTLPPTADDDPDSRRRLLQDIASKRYFNQESFVCFIDADDNIIAHPNLDRIGLYRGDQELDTTEGPRPFTRQTELTGGIWNNRQFSRVEIVSSLFDEGLGLTVAAHQNKSLVDQHLRAVRMYFVLFSVGVLGVLFGAAWWLTNARARKLVTQIERYESDLEAFNASVSHDLQGPIRSIDGFTRLLQQDCGEALDARGRGYLDNVRSACRRMERLVNDLLRLSQAARRELVPRAVDVSALAEEVVEGLRQKDPEREVSVVIAPGIEVRGDPDLLKIALENVIGNAWKYTGKRPQARIEVGVLENGRGNVCFVRDNGIGFDMKDASRLFEAFQRLHEGEFDGTGIGLATVKRVVERHGGRIWAEGRVDEGATIFFSLPGR